MYYDELSRYLYLLLWVNKIKIFVQTRSFCEKSTYNIIYHCVLLLTAECSIYYCEIKNDFI